MQDQGMLIIVHMDGGRCWTAATIICPFEEQHNFNVDQKFNIICVRIILRGADKFA